MKRTLQDYLNMYDLELTVDSGREVARDKAVVFDHTGIIMGCNKYSRRTMIFHNHPDTGPAIVDMAVYENGPTRCQYTNSPHDSWDVVLMRSFTQLEARNSYDAVKYNCQDATSYSRNGIATSSGRKATIGLTLAAIIIGGFLGGLD